MNAIPAAFTRVSARRETQAREGLRALAASGAEQSGPTPLAGRRNLPHVDQRAIDLLPTAQRRLDAQATLGEILGHLGLPAGEVAVDEHSVSHYVYLVQPPVDGVAKVGMGTSDRLRRWAAASWEVLAYWDTGSQERSREIEATALTLLRRAGAMDTPRLARLRAAFRGFDGVTEWFDTTVAQVQITLDDGHWHVVVEPPVDPS